MAHVILHLDVHSFVTLACVSKTGHIYAQKKATELSFIWMRCKREMSFDTQYHRGFCSAPRSLTFAYNVFRFAELNKLMDIAKLRRNILLTILMHTHEWRNLFREAYLGETLPTVNEMQTYGHRALIVKQLDLMDLIDFKDATINVLVQTVLQQSNLHGLLFNACVASRAIRMSKRPRLNSF